MTTPDRAPLDPLDPELKPVATEEAVRSYHGRKATLPPADRVSEFRGLLRRFIDVCLDQYEPVEAGSRRSSADAARTGPADDRGRLA